MEQVTLDTAFIEQGLAHIAFWNGRVLTAEDLRDEQLANQLARRQLGRALGSGVAHGMQVTKSTTLGQVEVAAGLAIDALGQVVDLPVDVTVSLVVPPETAHGDDLFTVCQPLASNSPTGTGVYLLVIRPATGSRSSVAGVSAFGNGVATECGPKYTVDGVSFRLVGVDAPGLAVDLGHDASDVSALDGVGAVGSSDAARNILAHLFLDTRTTSARALDPFGGSPAVLEQGAIAELRSGPLLAVRGTDRNPHLVVRRRRLRRQLVGPAATDDRRRVHGCSGARIGTAGRSGTSLVRPVPGAPLGDPVGSHRGTT